MSRHSRVSWCPPHSQRLFGVFDKWTPDGLARILRGTKVIYLDPSELTWEG
jgi:hypothetical protein